jgi:5'-nucleotidase
MKKPLILVDCDGPLADFSSGFLGLVEEETGYAFGPAAIDRFDITGCEFFAQLARDVGRPLEDLKKAVWSRASRIGFCSSLRPIPYALAALEQLREFATVECITSPLASNPTWMTERFEWLCRHMGFRKTSEVHFVSAKHRVPGEMLVDDKPEHVLEWVEASLDAGRRARGVLWDSPYNRDLDEEPDLRVASWDDVLRVAESIRV